MGEYYEARIGFLQADRIEEKERVNEDEKRQRDRKE